VLFLYCSSLHPRGVRVFITLLHWWWLHSQAVAPLQGCHPTWCWHSSLSEVGGWLCSLLRLKEKHSQPADPLFVFFSQYSASHLPGLPAWLVLLLSIPLFSSTLILCLYSCKFYNFYLGQIFNFCLCAGNSDLIWKMCCGKKCRGRKIHSQKNSRKYPKHFSKFPAAGLVVAR
jgi:hypothetical protein